MKPNISSSKTCFCSFLLYILFFGESFRIALRAKLQHCFHVKNWNNFGTKTSSFGPWGIPFCDDKGFRITLLLMLAPSTNTFKKDKSIQRSNFHKFVNSKTTKSKVHNLMLEISRNATFSNHFSLFAVNFERQNFFPKWKDILLAFFDVHQ